ncbi:MAG: cation:proton antiporter [Fibrobacteria bacterium]|nr:cation:proton antiporter [Fibrobacteria bacterium]
MEQVAFFHDLAIVLVVAAVSAVLFFRFHLPVVLGYIFAGFLIGPYFPYFTLISNESNIHTLSELGVVFLLFSLGLEFNLRKLRAIGTAAVLAGAVEIGGMLALGNLAGRFMGWGQRESMFLGAMLAISSTTIIVKVLTELKLKKETFADIVFGMLIVEDLGAILLLTLLSGTADGPSLFSMASLTTLGYLLVFLITSLILGLLIVPKITGFISSFKNDELLLISVLGLCLGFCLLVSNLGYSVALGAFLMGAILATTKAIGHIEKNIVPIRDLFCAVFFVSVGLKMNPSSLINNPGTIIIIFLVLIVGKTVLCSVGAFFAGKDFTSSLKVGMTMAQIGEFSFVIAALGVSQGALSNSLYSAIVSVSIISTFTTPLFIKSSETGARFLLKRLPDIVLSYLDLYYQWTLRFAERSRSNVVQNMLRRIGVKLGIFAALIAGVFIIALFLSKAVPALFPMPRHYIPWLETVLWLAALLSCMPILLQAIKKIKALGMILAELGITQNIAGSRYKEVRTILTNFFMLLGVSILVLYGGLLSSAILPAKNMLFFLIIIIGAVAYLMRNSFDNIYNQGLYMLTRQFERDEIEETAGGLTVPDQIEKKQIMLNELHTFQIEIEEGACTEGTLIRDTELRTRTGASILAIERGTQLFVNPGPEEEIITGDKLMLMGTPHQLADAQNLFEPKQQPEHFTTNE